MKRDILSEKTYPHAFECIGGECKQTMGCCPMWSEQTVSEIKPDATEETVIKAGCVGQILPIMVMNSMRLSGASAEKIAEMAQSVKTAAERTKTIASEQGKVLALPGKIRDVPPSGSDILDL